MAGPHPPSQFTAKKFQKQFNIFQTVNHASIIWEKKSKPKGFFGGHLNIRSLLPKFNQIEAILTQSNLDFLALTETWLSPSIDCNLIATLGFQLYRNDRTDKRGGGVAIYLNDRYRCELLPLSDINMEYLGLKILFNNLSFNIIVTYIPPKEIDNQLPQLKQIIKLCGDKETIILGDLNTNWLNKSSRAKLKLVCDKGGYSQLIKSPTRVTASSSTLIDLILSNRTERIQKTYNLITGLSDHNLTLLCRKQRKAKNTSPRPPAQTYIPKKLLGKLDNDIEKIIWDNSTKMNCNTVCDRIISKITGILKKYSKTMKSSKKKEVLPWLDDNLKSLMKKRDLVLKKFIKNKRQSDLLLFKSLRNKTTAAFRKTKANYFLTIIKNSNGNSKLLWEQIDKLMGKNTNKNKQIQLTIGDNAVTDSLPIASLQK